VFASIPIYYMANILFSKNLFSQAHSNYQDLLVARGTERATKQAHPLQIMGDNLQAKN
jgi:hypothetical protein